MTDPGRPRRVTEHHGREGARPSIAAWQPLLVLAVLLVLVVLADKLGFL